MRIPREQIAVALFDLLKERGAWKYAGRRLRMWTDMPPEHFPALFLTEWTEQRSYQGEGLPPGDIINYQVFVYCQTRDVAEGYVPTTQLNDLLEELDLALAPNVMTGRCDLGGLVSHAWIEGETLKFPGDLDGEGIAIIPVKVLVPY